VVGIKRESTTAVQPNALVVDWMDAHLFEISKLPTGVEINQQRAHVSRVVSGFSTFLGCRYVITSYRAAARYAGLGPEKTISILVRFASGNSAAQVKTAIQVHFPDGDPADPERV